MPWQPALGTQPLAPFDHQVAGQSSMLRYDKTTVCKPLIAREHFLYKTLPPELVEFTPEYRGEIEVQLSEEDGYIQLYGLCVDDDDDDEDDDDANHDVYSGTTIPVNHSNKHIDVKSKLISREPSIKNRSTIRVLRSGSYEVSLSTDEVFYAVDSNSDHPHTHNLNPWSLKNHKRLLDKMRKSEHSNNKIRFILLKNVVADFRHPCILDLKIGSRLHGDDASNVKVASQSEKCRRTTSSTLGVRLCGMQVYQVESSAYHSVDKYHGRTLNNESFREMLYNFLHNGTWFRSKLIVPIVLRLSQLIDCLEKLHSFRFYASSLLIIYDGDVDTRHDIKMKGHVSDITVDMSPVENIIDPPDESSKDLSYLVNENADEMNSPNEVHDSLIEHQSSMMSCPSMEKNQCEHFFDEPYCTHSSREACSSFKGCSCQHSNSLKKSCDPVNGSLKEVYFDCDSDQSPYPSLQNCNTTPQQQTSLPCLSLQSCNIFPHQDLLSTRLSLQSHNTTPQQPPLLRNSALGFVNSEDVLGKVNIADSANANIIAEKKFIPQSATSCHARPLTKPNNKSTQNLQLAEGNVLGSDKHLNSSPDSVSKHQCSPPDSVSKHLHSPPDSVSKHQYSPPDSVSKHQCSPPDSVSKHQCSPSDSVSKHLCSSAHSAGAGKQFSDKSAQSRISSLAVEKGHVPVKNISLLQGSHHYEPQTMQTFVLDQDSLSHNQPVRNYSKDTGQTHSDFDNFTKSVVLTRIQDQSPGIDYRSISDGNLCHHLDDSLDSKSHEITNELCGKHSGDHDNETVALPNTNELPVSATISDKDSMTSVVRQSSYPSTDDVKVDVKMIDFAHTTHQGFTADTIKHTGPDTDYILGLRNLIKMFQELQGRE